MNELKPIRGNDLMSADESRAPDLRQASDESAAQAEIQAAIVVAQRVPRNEMQVWEKCMRAAARPGMSEPDADGNIPGMYAFPRAGKKVTGPSVKLARELCRCWRNIRHGYYVTRYDIGQNLVTMRGYAWDLEANLKIELEHTFKYLIQRKVPDPNDQRRRITRWVQPDERDGRELIAKHGAFLSRNAMLQVLPPDLVEEALGVIKSSAKQTLRDSLESNRKGIIKQFMQIGVTVEDLQAYIGHGRAWSEDELMELAGVLSAIRDGHMSVSEIRGTVESKKPNNGVDGAENAKSGANSARSAAGLPPKKTAGQGKDSGNSVPGEQTDALAGQKNG